MAQKDKSFFIEARNRVKNYIIFSEVTRQTGCPGFQDLQEFLSESGCPGFQDLQDNSICLFDRFM